MSLARRTWKTAESILLPTSWAPQLTLKAPNAKDAQSVRRCPAAHGAREYLLQSQINPQLAATAGASR